jgi:hypothetical protein
MPSDKKNKRLPASEMLEHLKSTASHLGMDDDESDQFVHRGMKRGGYRISPAYSDPDDGDDDDDDDDDLMPRRRNSGGNRNQDSGNRSSGRQKSDPIWG